MAEKDTQKKESAEFVLKLDVEKVVFAGKKLGEEMVSAPIKMSNPTKDRYAFKVKCTSNDMFRIRPPVGAIQPGEDTLITVAFNAGKSIPESGKHYFAIYYIKTADKEKPARTVWGEHKGDAEGTKRVYVDFNKEKKSTAEKSSSKNDDKKEEKKEEKKDEKKEEKKEDEKKEEKKRGRKERRKERGKERGKEGRKEGRREKGRKERGGKERMIMK
ncbi:unnamed protein product [Caenorhabditis angaria]|uniref:Major sperm protein n=1 Tax=Caenorhabditis angaria TaxID=860376 RepID=A0A9P1IAI2_9PELO|nr:unnamed protein product [Caenorhabditis angaria]